ncbi:MAG: tetratricopeptide repeat protein [Endomicrobiaceae bacterium]
MFTKETAFVLIIMYIFLIYAFNYKITKKQIINNVIVLLPILIIYFILRNMSVANFEILKCFENLNEYVFNFFNVTATYVDKFIAADYIPVMLYKVHAGIKTIIINLMVLIFLAVIMYKRLVDKKIMWFSLLWFFICLLPTFLQFENVFLPHRFILPSLGIILMLTKLIKIAVDKYPASKKYLAVCFFMLFSVFSYSSYIQSDKYKNTDVFWVNAYVDARDYHAACAGLAKIYMKIGETDKAKELIQRSLNYRFSYRYLIAYADILLMENNLDEAEKMYLQILNGINGSKEILYRALSELYFRKEDFTKALEYAEKAYILLPYNIDYSKNLAKMYEMRGDYKKVIKLYEDLLKFDRNNKDYQNKIEFFYTKLNNKENINDRIR